MKLKKEDILDLSEILKESFNNDILLEGDTVKDWDAAREICRKCGRYEDEDE